MTSEIVVANVTQPAILCEDLDATMDRLHAMFGIFPSERVNIVNTGVHNAVYAFAGITFLELIQPYDPDCAAMRLLKRHGEGFHMVAFDLTPASPEAIEAALHAGSFRVVRRNRTARIAGAWHIHPGDTLGVLIALALKHDPTDNSDWAGPAWREYVGTNTRVISRVLGVSVACNNIADGIARYEALGFQFGDPALEEGDHVAEALTEGGTVLCLRAPAGGAGSLAARHLAHRGTGLCHLILEAADSRPLRDRLSRAGVRFEERNTGQSISLWTEPSTTWGIPFEIRSADASA